MQRVDFVVVNRESSPHLGDTKLHGPMQVSPGTGMSRSIASPHQGDMACAQRRITEEPGCELSSEMLATQSDPIKENKSQTLKKT